MTFTATFPIGYAPGSPHELFIEDAPLVVEFEADVVLDWDKSVGQGGCDVDNVDIESAMLEVVCGRCKGEGMVGERGCRICQSDGKEYPDILLTLSAPDLARLKEECAEWAREHAVDS